MKVHLTIKQTQILGLIHAKNPDGSLLDLDQLLDALPYETTKQSIHFSLRALINRGFLVKAGREKRRGRQHGLLDLGPAGKLRYGVDAPGPSIVVSEEEHAAEMDLGAALIS